MCDRCATQHSLQSEGSTKCEIHTVFSVVVSPHHHLHHPRLHPPLPLPHPCTMTDSCKCTPLMASTAQPHKDITGDIKKQHNRIQECDRSSHILPPLHPPFTAVPCRTSASTPSGPYSRSTNRQLPDPSIKCSPTTKPLCGFSLLLPLLLLLPLAVPSSPPALLLLLLVTMRTETKAPPGNHQEPPESSSPSSSNTADCCCCADIAAPLPFPAADCVTVLLLLLLAVGEALLVMVGTCQCCRSSLLLYSTTVSSCIHRHRQHQLSGFAASAQKASVHSPHTAGWRVCNTRHCSRGGEGGGTHHRQHVWNGSYWLQAWFAFYNTHTQIHGAVGHNCTPPST